MIKLVFKDIKILFVYSFVRKLFGIYFRKKDVLMVFNKCWSVHTFLMRRKIDVAFMDSKFKIVNQFRNIKPNKIISDKRAEFVIERISSKEKWFEVGDRFFQRIKEVI